MARKLDTTARWFNKVHQWLFRRTGGRVGGRMLGVELVALTTIGRKSGERRTSMVGAPIVEEDLVVVVASYAAGPTNPQWYYNLLAEPRVEVTHRRRRRELVAREVAGDELVDLWARVAAVSDLEKYQARTERRIPLIALEPPAEVVA